MPLILAIETATPLCSVALGRDAQLLALREVNDGRLAHAEKLNVFIAQVLEEAGVAMNALSAVAVGTGPGSYTGLRIGLSAAKGLCYALDRPIIGIGTLHTLAQAAHALQGPLQGTLWPMVDARRMEVFSAPFTPTGRPLADTAPLILDAAWAGDPAPRVVFGDGADKAVALWKDQASITHLPGVRPSAAHLLPLAVARFQAGQFDDLAYLVPEYGKAANTGIARPRITTPPGS